MQQPITGPSTYEGEPSPESRFTSEEKQHFITTRTLYAAELLKRGASYDDLGRLSITSIQEEVFLTAANDDIASRDKSHAEQSIEQPQAEVIPIRPN